MEIDSGKIQENQSQRHFRPGVLHKEIHRVPLTLLENWALVNLMSAISSKSFGQKCCGNSKFAYTFISDNVGIIYEQRNAS